jgi:hypothetical protein
VRDRVVRVVSLVVVGNRWVNGLLKQGNHLVTRVKSNAVAYAPARRLSSEISWLRVNSRTLSSKRAQLSGRVQRMSRAA